MPKILKTQCPHCRKTMKLKSSKAFGKQAQCPKCKKPFRVKRIPSPVKNNADDYAADDYDADDYDDYGDDDYSDDDYGDDEYDEPRQQPRSSRKRSGGKKKQRRKTKKKTGNFAKPILLIGAGVLGVGLIGVTIWFAAGLIGLGNRLDLAYLPPDATSIVINRPAKDWSQNVGMSGLTSKEVDSILKKQRDMWGVSQKDIKSITNAANSRGERIHVVRSSSNFDTEKILGHAANHEKAEHNGKQYYRIGLTAIFLPNQSTMITGLEEAVKNAIDRGSKSPDREQLNFVDSSYDRVSVTVFGGSSPRPNSFLDDTNPQVIFVGTDHGTSSGKIKTQGAFATESDAIAAFDKASAAQEKLRQDWENGGRDLRRQRLQTSGRVLGSNLQYTEEEIEDALNCHDSELKSISVSRSGLIVTMTRTGYVTKFSKRVQEDLRSRFNPDPTRIAKVFGRTTFGIAVR